MVDSQVSRCLTALRSETVRQRQGKAVIWHLKEVVATFLAICLWCEDRVRVLGYYAWKIRKTGRQVASD
jgi:hypothetical protein